MAVTRSRRSDRSELRQESSQARGWWTLELGAMLLTTLLVMIGLFAVYRAERERYAPASPDASRPLLLSGIDTADGLLPALRPVFPEPADQHFAAKWLWHHLSTELGGPTALSHVGALASARVPLAQIRATPDLVAFKRELERVTAGQDPGKPGQDSIRVLSSRQLQLFKQQVAVRSIETFRSRLLLAALLFLAGIYLPLVGWAVRRRQPDLWLLPIAQLLSGLGLILMVSLQDPLRDTLRVHDFAVGVVGGGVLMLAASLIDFQASTLRRLSFVPLLGALLTSLLLVTLGTGPAGSDARVNLSIGPVTLQPVEAVKLLVVLFLAGYFTRRWELLRSLRQHSSRMPHLFRWLELPRWRDFFPVVVGMVLALAFLFIQKDLGPALVLGWTFLALYSVARGRFGLALAGISVLVLGCVVAYQLGYPQTVTTRISMWLDPWENGRRGGDQLAMGLWAVAAGGFDGAGLGHGETARVPAAHTDFILAVVAEELGFVGMFLVVVLYGALLWRGLWIALRSEGDYPHFLALGATVLLGGQLVLIGAGVLGLLPLSGVTTPLLSYGKSSQWSVFLVLGVLAALSTRPAGEVDLEETPARRFGPAVRRLALAGGILLAALVVKAAWMQLKSPDEVMTASIRALQAGGEIGYVVNPRLQAIAERIPRGTLFDRNGLPIASSDRALLERKAEELAGLGIKLDQACPEANRRCYPLGGQTFHLLGDLREPVNWASPITAFAEKTYGTRLQGYDDFATYIEVEQPNGQRSIERRRNLKELLPIWWHRGDPSEPEVKRLLERDRDLILTLDGRLQARVAGILARGVKKEKLKAAAAVVLNPATGEVLASVSYPFPAEIGAALRKLSPEAPELLDRARFGIYPPGSTFKIVTAMAALRRDAGLGQVRYSCQPLPGEEGRVGVKFPRLGRPIRDDKGDPPHGSVDLATGMKVSCNAYFAQLAMQGVQGDDLFKTAKLFGIRTINGDDPAKLRDLLLAYAGFGQGEVVAHPMQLAQVAGTVANGGRLVAPTLLREDATAAPPSGQEVLKPAQALEVARAMRLVVTGGTGQRVFGDFAVPVAGKTGTAEVGPGKLPHSWFVGYAPYGETAEESAPRITFAVLAENAGYGGRVAAPMAREIVEAARSLGLIAGSEMP